MLIARTSLSLLTMMLRVSVRLALTRLSLSKVQNPNNRQAAKLLSEKEAKIEKQLNQ